MGIIWAKIQAARNGDSMLRNSWIYCEGGYEMVEQASRRAVKGEDTCFFVIALQLVESLRYARHVGDSSTGCMKSK